VTEAVNHPALTGRTLARYARTEFLDTTKCLTRAYMGQHGGNQLHRNLRAARGAPQRWTRDGSYGVADVTAPSKSSSWAVARQIEVSAAP